MAVASSSHLSMAHSFLQERADAETAPFAPSKAILRNCYTAFLEELSAGLAMHSRDPHNFHPEQCSMMMLDSCVDFVPTGKEKGVVYAIDFGGTNLRAIRVELDGTGTATVKALKHDLRNEKVSRDLPKGLLDKKATASLLFDDIAVSVNKLITSEGDQSKGLIGVGFTFSFPMVQKTINSALLNAWTKGFETGTATNDPVVGRDVGALLDSAFTRNGVNAKVIGVLNDTVGAMLSGSYSKKPDQPPCTVGVILGTGVNGAYVQRDTKSFGYQGVVVNTELGGFNKGLPTTPVDMIIDYQSTSRGRQIFEKMVSGMYVPEITRLLVVRIFQQLAPPLSWVPSSMTGEGCGAILGDVSPYRKTAEVMMDLWDWTCPNLAIVHQIVTAVFQRSAALSAVAISAMAKATGRLQPAMGGVTVGLDGTLYVQNVSYQRMIREYLELILGKSTADLVYTVIAEDGSGKGAAILAGTVMSAKKAQ